MNKYSISREATQDLDQISNYLGDRNLELSERFLQRFADRCKKLINFPQMGRVYAKLDCDIRGLTFDGYIIFYRLIKDEVEIIRVISGRQNLADLFSDDDL